MEEKKTPRDISEIKILLVDDESDFLDPMAYWLKSKGYQTLTAAGGEEALEQLKEQSVDIVFLDINMAGLDGIQTLRKIREELKIDVPVIMVTAYGTKDRLIEAEKLGISGFFPKEDGFEKASILIQTVLRLHKDLKTTE
ncbi:MAG: response regulator [Candidatus Omnitrophica bacterium]|nr:response regulator [Candidatus Omnitrophota bacterium]